MDSMENLQILIAHSAYKGTLLLSSVGQDAVY